jgi:RIO-like serine/threonine protein kinase
MENAAASLVPSRIALNMSTITLQQHLGRLASQRTMTLATETAVGRDIMGVVKDYFQRYQQYAADFIAGIRNTTNPSERVQRANDFANYNISILTMYYQYMQTYMTENPSQASIIRRNFEGIREGFRNNMRELMETVRNETMERQRDIDALMDRYNRSLDEMQL